MCAPSQVARLEWGRSEGYRALFDHVDRAGGIFSRRWGADPFMFIAATLLLPARAILHFDDVSYLHQHLVMNLPAAPPPDLTPTPPRDLAATSRDLAATSRDLPAADEASSSCGALGEPPPSRSAVGVESEAEGEEAAAAEEAGEAAGEAAEEAAEEEEEGEVWLLVHGAAHAAAAASTLQAPFPPPFLPGLPLRVGCGVASLASSVVGGSPLYTA